jgi:hypothetical protein
MEPCEGCGTPAPGGTAGCQSMFEELLARDFSDVAYFSVHRLLVDTYALQHPERYCVSPKSLAAHLMGLCWAMERGGGRSIGSEALRAWLDGPARLQKPEIPSHRGKLTIADVRSTPDVAAHVRAVDLWARSTWAAYASLHETARAWIEQALAEGSGRLR